MSVRLRNLTASSSMGVVLLLAACSTDTGGNSGDSNSPNQAENLINNGPECQIEPMRSWVQSNMQDYYLFYNQVPQVSLGDYSSIERLIEDLRVSPYDRYSYIADESLSTALFEEGTSFGFGMRLTRTPSNELRFALVNPGSPLDNAGVLRGERLVAIDGVAIDSPGLTSEFIDAALGTGDEVVSPRFTIENIVGQRRDVVVTKTNFNLQTVLETSVTTVGSNRVGYLHFLSFLETSSAELDQAFETLASENINELVLDLRYNSGGRISVANELASKIVGDGAAGADFTYFSHNDKYASYNQGYPFIDDVNSLNLSRVVVLATDDTCSASELVINGLRPFMEVITVGGTSCGKPYGTSGRTRCGKVMHALEVEFQNNSQVGGYFDGIPADCPANDDVFESPGVPGDPLMDAALGYIDQGSCTMVAGRSLDPEVSQLPPMNLLDLEKRHLLE
ncbi:MAG: hypothetical protein KTR35_01115 [Gammaproteobacteria bacterium]|nr:hypothetical protein [Gammaproteobacteria bacterium]